MPLLAASGVEVDTRARAVGTAVGVKVRTRYTRARKWAGAHEIFAAITKFLPRKLRIFVKSSISRKFCAAKI